MNTVNKHREQGHVLAEVLLALAFSVMMMMAILRYFEVLTRQFSDMSERQKLWQNAHLILESYPQINRIPLSKQVELNVKKETKDGCLWVTVELVSQTKKSAMLSRLFCEP